MKDLPKVFQNNLDKKFNNNSSVYYSSNDNRSSTIKEVKDNNELVLEDDSEVSLFVNDSDELDIVIYDLSDVNAPAIFLLFDLSAILSAAIFTEIIPL